MRHAKEILERYRSGLATDEERILVERWWLSHNVTDHLEWTEQMEKDISSSISHAVLRQVYPIAARKWNWIRYAAAVVLALLLIGIYTTNLNERRDNTQLIANILPASNKATLTYADGTVLALSEQQQGIVTGGKLTYLDGTAVTSDEQVKQKLLLATPKGGVYQAVLPDGTHVWLNADSKLSYPSVFDAKERVVELEGEAYFEVKRITVQQELIPFLVKTKAQTVSVLGTAFNVAAYPDDAQVKTTLESGIVEVYKTSGGQRKRLTPGQQSRVGTDEFVINDVDVEAAVAWKNGYFNFDRSDVDEVLKQFSRWYDVAFVYQGKRKNLKLSGSIHRNVSADRAMAILGYFDLNYQLYQEGRQTRIIIKDN